jgi:hypothetical protein
MSNAGGVALLVAAGEQEDFRPLFAHPKTGHLLAWVHQEPTFWGGALLLTAEFVSAPWPVARGTLEGPFSSCSPAARRRTMKAASAHRRAGHNNRARPGQSVCRAEHGKGTCA